MVFNIVQFFASSIHVSYNEGQTCRCYDGRTTLVSPGQSGEYTFILPRTGVWTVTDGIATEIVTITQPGQSVNVNLNRLYLFIDKPSEVSSSNYQNYGNNRIHMSASRYYSSEPYDNYTVTNVYNADISRFSKIGISVEQFTAKSSNLAVYVHPSPVLYPTAISLPTDGLAAGTHKYNLPAYSGYSIKDCSIYFSISPALDWESWTAEASMNFTGKIWLE